MERLRQRGVGTFASAYLSAMKAELHSTLRQKQAQMNYTGRGEGDIEDQQNPLLVGGAGTSGDQNETSLPSNLLAEMSSLVTDFSLWTRVVLGIAASALLFNMRVFFGFGSMSAVLAGLIAMGTAVTVGMVQLKLEEIESLREVHNGLRRDANKFAAENDTLSRNIGELEIQVSGMKEVEQKLHDITRYQSTSADGLVRLVKENKVVLEKMKRVIRFDIVSDLMDAVLRGEKDESGHFSSKEIQRLIIYMRGLPAVKVNEDLLKQAIKKDSSMFSLMTLIMDIAEAGTQEGDHIFDIREDDKDLQRSFLAV